MDCRSATQSKAVLTGLTQFPLCFLRGLPRPTAAGRQPTGAVIRVTNHVRIPSNCHLHHRDPQ